MVRFSHLGRAADAAFSMRVVHVGAAYAWCGCFLTDTG